MCRPGFNPQPAHREKGKGGEGRGGGREGKSRWPWSSAGSAYLPTKQESPEFDPQLSIKTGVVHKCVVGFQN